MSFMERRRTLTLPSSLLKPKLIKKEKKSEEIKDSYYDFNWFDWFIYR